MVFLAPPRLLCIPMYCGMYVGHNCLALCCLVGKVVTFLRPVRVLSEQLLYFNDSITLILFFIKSQLVSVVASETKKWPFFARRSGFL